MNMREISNMPWIHLFVSPACNLKCEYCSQYLVRETEVKNDFLQDEELLNFISHIPPTHLYISGGEPLIHPGIKEFVNYAGKLGHKISIDTNIAIGMQELKNLLSYWNLDYIGFINISHHIVCGLTLEYINERAQLLKSLGVKFFVKYVGVPEHFSQIKENMRFFKGRGVGTAVTILQGEWGGRNLPADYSFKETIELLEMVTLKTHALQLFEGVRCNGLLCRGGQDFIAYNMHNDKKVLPCCHGSKCPINLERTFFKTGINKKLICQMEYCLGDIMFMFGINQLYNEIERFDEICKGNAQSVGLNEIFGFIDNILKEGYNLYNNEKYFFIRHNNVNEHDKSLIIKSKMKQVSNTFQESYKLLDKLANKGKNNILIFGTGNRGKVFYKIVQEYNEISKLKINIIGFLDNDNKKYGKLIFNKQISKPNIKNIEEVDYVIICSDWKEDIKKQLVSIGIDINKIKSDY